MARTIGRGVKKEKETLESVKAKLEVAQKAGAELVAKNEELEKRIKELETNKEQLKQKNEELEAKVGKTIKPKEGN